MAEYDHSKCHDCPTEKDCVEKFGHESIKKVSKEDTRSIEDKSIDDVPSDVPYYIKYMN
jgi:hypothetical protein